MQCIYYSCTIIQLQYFKEVASSDNRNYAAIGKLITFYFYFLSAPDDYVMLDELLTFSPSQPSITIDVAINDDQIVEVDELFKASLTLVTDNSRVTINPALADVTIRDNDGE